VTTTGTRGPAGGDTEAPAARPRRRRPGRRATVITAVVVLAAAGGVTAGWSRIERIWEPRPAAATTYSGGTTATATVTRQDLTARQDVDGRLGYSGDYSVLSKSRGTLTWVPDIGKVIKEGETVYRVDGDKVVLLYGPTPAYRDLAEGDEGADVKELNAALVDQGYATSGEIDRDSDHYGSATAEAVTELQDDLGVTQDGVLHLGQAVFLPTALRVTSVPGVAGGPASGPVLKGTSTERQVTVELDASQVAQVRKGDKVTITLPDDATTTGRVTDVGTVATEPKDDSDSPTVEVDITPAHPSRTGHIDQGQVQVGIITDRVKDALVVPVTALLATTGGGYAVEVIDPNGRHRLVPVSTGTFDDSAGLVQVTGPGLKEGEKIVVAAS